MTAGAASHRPASRRQALAVAALALAATLPFLNKAFHIDDVLYLTGADRILHRQSAYFGHVLWDAKDGQPAPLFQTDYNPPAWKYMLAAVIALFGRSEPVLHLMTSACVWLAAWGLWRLSREFTEVPLWCAAIILLGPFLLPGQNVMLEAPLLCLSLWGVERQLAAWKTDRSRDAWIAGALLSLALLTKYTAALVPAFLAAAGYWQRRRRSYIVLVLPALTFVGWSLYTYVLHGRPHLDAERIHAGPADWPVRALIVFRCIGAVTVFGPAVAFALWRHGRGGRWGLLGSLLGGAVLAAVDVHQARGAAEAEGWTQPVLQAVHMFAFTWHGAFLCLGLVVLTLVDWRRQRLAERHAGSERLLVLWLAVLFAFNVVAVPFNAIRHLLLFFVPMTWLVGIWLVRVGSGPALRRNLAVGSALLAMGLAAADYEIAGVYRHLVQTKVRGLVRTGRTVWFTGNWGFVYYSWLEGAFPLVQNPSDYGLPAVRPGDLVVKPLLLTWNPVVLPAGMQALPVDHWQPAAANPLRTMAAWVHYYAIPRHSLPWELLVVPGTDGAPFELPDWDEIVVYEVVRTVQ